MTDYPQKSQERPCWFVGASFGGVEDQTKRFVNEGIWENYNDKYLDEVKFIQPGDRIAIKSSYTRKKKLPFDNRGQTVSVMVIKAIGTVKENHGDGHFLKVDWQPIDPPREWYFYTNRSTVWKVLPGNSYNDKLILFTFEGKKQDVNWFRNAPYWRERFGDVMRNNRRFKWTSFYEAMADKILKYKNNRKGLIEGIYEIGENIDNLSYLQDRTESNEKKPLDDICPFSVMGTFNRNLGEKNRIKIAQELAKFLGVRERVPESFEGLPILDARRSCFFGFGKDRGKDDIDILWEVFEAALEFAKQEEDASRARFIKAYDRATKCFGVGWNLTMGLYWIRPWNFMTLDNHSQYYIEEKIGTKILKNGPKKHSNAEDYLNLLEELDKKFKQDSFPVHSFPELSLAAWESKGSSDPPVGGSSSDPKGPKEKKLYTLDSILEDGCFMNRADLEKMLERLRTKKNLILQGPPGTGKTWLSKKISYALIGEKDDSKVRAVQFHPNLSYEDFVRGLRPSSGGNFDLTDGPLMEMINTAKNDPDARYVLVIEEINRGNPAQIFGEMLTLLEADKRNPQEALELCYRRFEDECVYVPENLYIIGTMNIADRSIAMVDLALRRRFAFINLKPTFNTTWREWVKNHSNLNDDVLIEVEKRIKNLNEEISSDPGLGSQFCIGHSYVTPRENSEIHEGVLWFQRVVETEIQPLLEEYWFENPEKAQKESEKLVEGL